MDAITTYLDLGSYSQWSEEKRQEFLIAELNNRRPLIPSRYLLVFKIMLTLSSSWPEDDLTVAESVKEVIATFRMAADVPPECLGAYIISMARTPSDVLSVELLQKTCGNTSPQRVVPLFETKADLETSAKTIRRLLNVDWYRKHIRGNQEVMLGYSDSAKGVDTCCNSSSSDSGRFSSVWGLYQAQEELVQVCHEYQVSLNLFHGRGGASLIQLCAY
jgi:phosphoenolpyruvate carboxylase